MHRQLNFMLFGIILALNIALMIRVDFEWPTVVLPIVMIVISIIGIYSQHKDNKNLKVK